MNAKLIKDLYTELGIQIFEMDFAVGRIFIRNRHSVIHLLAVALPKRDQAIEALELCHEQGVSLLHFAREGICPILLQELYSEIGIEIDGKKLAPAWRVYDHFH